MGARKVRFEEYEVDFGSRELRKQGIRVRLQNKPFRVLELLLRRPGELVSREELVKFLWPDSHVSFEHGLNTAVNSLRQVLGESSRRFHLIETRPGLGYRFVAAVEEVTGIDSAPSAEQGSDNGKRAHEDCLKGRFLLDTMAEEDIYKAIAFFKSAAADEACSPSARAGAHAGIADAYCQLASLGCADATKLAPVARAAADAALQINPDLAEAQAAAGRVRMLFDWDWKGARDASNKALKLDARSVSARTLCASLCAATGEYDEALEACREALAVAPLSFPANLQLAACLYAARRYEEVVDQCWKVLTLSSRFALAQLLLALAYEQLGLYEEAVVEFENARRCISYQTAATAGLGHLFAVVGCERDAEEAFSQLLAQAHNRYVSYYSYAVVCAGRQQESPALLFLEEALRQRDPALRWLRADARFDGMRSNDRFEKILTRIGPKVVRSYALDVKAAAV